MDVKSKVEQQLAENAVMIYMKGTPEMPQCGFSANAVKALNATGVPYSYVNVLENVWIYEKLPSISRWPTYPQIFAAGELLGGCDIVVEMLKDGFLKPTLEAAVEKYAAAVE